MVITGRIGSGKTTLLRTLLGLLPQDAGDALLKYLSLARPRVAHDRVFLRSSAPYRPFKTSCAISDVVRLALKRAGIADAPSRGANLLRHSAATGMLRAGGYPRQPRTSAPTGNGTVYSPRLSRRSI